MNDRRVPGHTEPSIRNWVCPVCSMEMQSEICPECPRHHTRMKPNKTPLDDRRAAIRAQRDQNR